MVASLGTVIFICVPLTLVMPASCPEPIHAAVMAVKPVPVTVITVPGPPLVGLMELMVGCDVLAVVEPLLAELLLDELEELPLEELPPPTVKVWELNPQWVPFPNAIKPVAASLGTTTCRDVLVSLLTVASCPVPTQAFVMADRPVPETVMTVPGAPLVGLIEVM